MKIKRIMLMTLLLLAVLTIGAVSAADDAASQNLTVTDESASDNLAVDDEVAEDDLIGVSYDPDEHYIEVWDEIIIDENDEDYDEDESIADITLPKNTQGSFKVYNNEVIVSQMDFEEEDEDDTWYVEGKILTGSILLKNFDLKKVKDGDVLTFKFFEKIDGQETVVDDFTVQYKVGLTSTVMSLTEMGDSGMTEEDVEIQVNDINTTNPDENFTFVNVAVKQGIFTITVEDTEEDEIVIFMENLYTTQRPYTIIDDGKSNKSYRFGFSFSDINNYLLNSEYQCTFLQSINNGFIDGNEIYFSVIEDDEDETEIDSKTMSFQIKEGMILFKDEDDIVDVDPADELEIIMNEGWQESEVFTFTVKEGTKGKIVICLDNNTVPVFEKDISELTAADDSDEYTIIIADLNITQAGTYVIRVSFVDDKGVVIYSYEEDDPINLTLHEPQIISVGNVSINIDKRSTLIDGSEVLITIGVNASSDEIVEILIDGKYHFQIKLNETRNDEDGNYTIGTAELKFRPAAGQHTVNITYKNQNASGIINLRSNLEIDITKSPETIFTTFNNIFVYLTLEEGEILESDINGMINVTIIDAGGKVVDDFEKNITELDQYDGDYVIRADADKGLNGTYKVIVRYFHGNEIDTQAEANVTFKVFDAKDCGAVIMESITDKKDYAITFTSLPQSGFIFVEIVGENTVQIKEENLDDWFDEEKGVYYIKFNELGALSDGTHSITVYVVSANGDDIDLASGDVTVDVEENIDPELSISIANITEGKDAVINIKTHANFSGIIPVQIANVTYNVNVTNGTGSLAVPGLAVGNYNATAVFNDNVFYNASTKNTTFTVNAKVATSISAADVITTYATSKNILITLKDADGNALAEKEVSVVFNGAAKNLKTNANGQVSIAIGTKLAPKTYPVTFSFAGDDELLASSGSAKVMVKKAKSKLTAKKKTFKAKKKVKKYTVTLKSDKGKAIKKVKLTLKVKGKKYKAKTNNKGKATFKIKKLTKKGKHKATIRFAGNKCYNKVTKKVKITVKK